MTKDQTATYRTALKEARATYERNWERLIQISEEQSNLESEISKLRRTITALAAMCSEDPGLDELGITESVAEVMERATNELTSAEVARGLALMGFDLDSQKNIQASVHAILTRLANKGKITKTVDEQTKAIRWRGPNCEERPF